MPTEKTVVEALVAEGESLLAEGNKNPLGNAEARRLHHAARAKELGLRAKDIYRKYVNIDKPTAQDKKRTTAGLNAADISAQRHAMHALPYDEATESENPYKRSSKRSALMQQLRRERRSFGKPGAVTPSKHPDVLALDAKKKPINSKYNAQYKSWRETQKK